jgi:hypothetical protein
VLDTHSPLVCLSIAPLYGLRYSPVSCRLPPSDIQDKPPTVQVGHYGRPTVTPWVHRFAQDSIKPGQWVKVESGDHLGAIGKPVDIMHSVASIALTSMGNGPNLLIPLRALVPLYRCGDNIKCRWSESCGLVSSVDEVEMTLTFVEKDSNNIVSVNTWTWRSLTLY